MAYGLIDKLTNFLMPVEGAADFEQVNIRERKAQLRVHVPTALKIFIATPRNEDEVRLLADCLKNNMAVLVNYEYVDQQLLQGIHDFLSGVAFVIDGSAERISDNIYMYLPQYAQIEKQLFAVSIPTYVKNKG
ncbi:MAG TPA: cell division protein SepF [Sporomusaceae bacterium]|nr:cell division protein SepF [Sporomusaceae bacterium]